MPLSFERGALCRAANVVVKWVEVSKNKKILGDGEVAACCGYRSALRRHGGCVAPRGCAPWREGGPTVCGTFCYQVIARYPGESPEEPTEGYPALLREDRVVYWKEYREVFLNIGFLWIRGSLVVFPPMVSVILGPIAVGGFWKKKV